MRKHPSTGEEEFWEIDGRVRIERGLGIHRDVIATPELLKRLSPEYNTPHPTFFKNHPVHADKHGKCALGQNGEPIEMGKPMSYITYPVDGVDHGWKNNGFVWWVFRLEDDPRHLRFKTFDQIAKLSDGSSVLVQAKPPELDPTHSEHGKRWIEKGQFVELADAEALAATL
jgi:hypothetical protein